MKSLWAYGYSSPAMLWLTPDIIEPVIIACSFVRKICMQIRYALGLHIGIVLIAA